MTDLDKLRALSGWERGVLLRAVVALPVISAGLRGLGLGRMQRILARLTPARAAQVDNLDEARSMARVVNAAGHRMRVACLGRSLTLWWLLRRRGMESSIHLGASKNGSDFAAHAWVEMDGSVLNDRPDVGERFVTFSG